MALVLFRVFRPYHNNLAEMWIWSCTSTFMRPTRSTFVYKQDTVNGKQVLPCWSYVPNFQVGSNFQRLVLYKNLSHLFLLYQKSNLFFFFFFDKRGVLFKYILCQTTASIITFMGHNMVVPKCSISHTKVAYTKLGQVS